MAQAKYYSPQFDRTLVSQLYFEAKARRIPMTVLTNLLVEEALSRRVDVDKSAEHDTGRGEQSTEVDDSPNNKITNHEARHHAGLFCFHAKIRNPT